jgi:hypothetical protein
MSTRRRHASTMPFFVLLAIAATALCAPITLELTGGSVIKSLLMTLAENLQMNKRKRHAEHHY